MSIARPKLPSVLPSQPALQDGMYIFKKGRYMPCYYRIVVSTTKDETNTGLARATNPVECVERLSLTVYIDFLRQDTDIYMRICGWVALSGWSKRESDGDSQIVTDCSHR